MSEEGVVRQRVTERTSSKSTKEELVVEEEDDSKSVLSSRSSKKSKPTKDSSSDEADKSDSDTSYKSIRSFQTGTTHRTTQRSTSKSKVCPKRRTCCGFLVCICKVSIILITTVMLLLLGLGFMLAKLDFECNLDDLSPSLYSNIYGEDVAIRKAVESVTDYCKGLSFNEPLVLVLWGPTGVGKTAFASIFTHHFHPNGQVVPSEHFKSAKFKEWLVSQSHDKPFVYTVDDVMSLEEMENIVTDADMFSFPLILVLTTSMDSHILNESFIDWCVTGGSEGDFVYTGKDPEWQTQLKPLNPVVIPFLPLSKTNIKLCIEKTLNRLKMRYKKEDVESIANEFEYFNNGKRLYSNIGCKRVNDKIFSVLSP